MSIAENYKKLVDRVSAIENRLGIDYIVKIVAVTKTRTVEEIRQVIEAGAEHIGENRVQEAKSKLTELRDEKITRHMIGHLQTNKANNAAELFDMIQSVDSLELARKLDAKAGALEKKLEILIEVKTSFEESKEGISTRETSELMGEILEMPNLRLTGLMTIAPFVDDEKTVRAAFKRLADLREKLRNEYRDAELNELSMGMTDDYEWAIEEGSTLIRPGRLIFGERYYG